jgi:hypothetical protein
MPASDDAWSGLPLATKRQANGRRACARPWRLACRQGPSRWVRWCGGFNPPRADLVESQSQSVSSHSCPGNSVRGAPTARGRKRSSAGVEGKAAKNQVPNVALFDADQKVRVRRAQQQALRGCNSQTVNRRCLTRNGGQSDRGPDALEPLPVTVRRATRPAMTPAPYDRTPQYSRSLRPRPTRRCCYRSPGRQRSPR